MNPKKPCPFCGGRNVLITNPHSGTPVKYVAICAPSEDLPGCGASGTWCDTEDEACRKWDARACIEIPKNTGNPHDKQFLQEMAGILAAKLPDNHGFILLAIPYEGGDGRMKYISSLTRQTAVLALKEFLINCGSKEDWMKHIR